MNKLKHVHIVETVQGSKRKGHGNCHNCADWNYDRDDILGVHPPKLYPKISHPQSPKPPNYHEAGAKK